MSNDADTRMDFVARLAERAGEITRGHFGRVAVQYKTDGSEVTAADHEAEEFIRKVLQEEHPDDGVLGEEGEDVPSRSGRRWIIDPIDGTRSFSAGVPLYGILIALEEEGEPVLGCAHFPELGKTVVAAIGAGAWQNGTRVRVSECDDLAAARVITSGLEYWRDWGTDAGRAGLNQLIGSSRFTRTWGDCYGYVMVATGHADVLADPAVGSYWDMAPVMPILQEAGGRFTTLRGEPVRAWSSALATNGRLHGAAMACWESYPDPLADPGR